MPTTSSAPKPSQFLFSSSHRQKALENPLMGKPSTPEVEVAASKNQHKAAWGAMLAGTALSVYGWTRKSASGAALGVAGGAIALKAATAGPIADLVGTESVTRRSVMVMRSPGDLYTFWKDVEKAPQWMEQITSVTRIDEHRTRWARPCAGGGTLEWTTEITEDVPNRSLGWRTIPDSDSDYDLSPRVEFTELGPGRGTEVTFTLRYKLHGGLLHSKCAMILGEDPEHQIRETLRHFKMLMEAGEVATIQGQSHGPRKLKGKLMQTLLREEDRAPRSPVRQDLAQSKSAAI